MTENIAKRVGIGHQISVSINQSSSLLVNLGVLTNVQGGTATKKSINVSLYGDTTDTFLPGEIDAGTFEFEIALDPDNVSNVLLAQIFNQTASDTIPLWQIKSPASLGSTAQPTRQFLGFIEKMDETYVKDALVMRKIGVKCTGSPNYNVST